MQRLKSYLGMKQNIGADSSESIDGNVKEIDSENSEKNIQKLSLGLSSEQRNRETTVGVDVPEHTALPSPDYYCKWCKVSSVTGGYTACLYVVYMIRRDYNSNLVFRQKSTLVQAGIIASILFTIGTCQLLDIDISGKTGPRVDAWFAQKRQEAEQRQTGPSKT